LLDVNSFLDKINRIIELQLENTLKRGCTVMSSLNLTTPRKTVLELVRGTTSHPTATDLMQMLGEHGYRFAYATIYNSLRYLADHGLIRELNLGNGITRYDGRMEDHHHIVCQYCSQISEGATDIPAEFLKRFEDETGYQILELNVQFVGVCPECRAKQKKSKSTI
jgi:Fur family transcriptional regulator, peroxide stress response regulator